MLELEFGMGSETARQTSLHKAVVARRTASSADPLPSNLVRSFEFTFTGDKDGAPSPVRPPPASQQAGEAGIALVGTSEKEATSQLLPVPMVTQHGECGSALKASPTGANVSAVTPAYFNHFPRPTSNRAASFFQRYLVREPPRKYYSGRRQSGASSEPDSDTLTIVRREVLNLEMRLAQLLITSGGPWQVRRDQWVKEVQTGTTARELAELCLELEHSLQPKMFCDSWCTRPGAIEPSMLRTDMESRVFLNIVCPDYISELEQREAERERQQWAQVKEAKEAAKKRRRSNPLEAVSLPSPGVSASSTIEFEDSHADKYTLRHTLASDPLIALRDLLSLIFRVNEVKGYALASEARRDWFDEDTRAEIFSGFRVNRGRPTCAVHLSSLPRLLSHQPCIQMARFSADKEQVARLSAQLRASSFAPTRSHRTADSDDCIRDGAHVGEDELWARGPVEIPKARSPERTFTVTVGQHYDVFQSGRWYSGNVLEQRPGTSTPSAPFDIKVHYKGWSTRKDEWINGASVNMRFSEHGTRVDAHGAQIFNTARLASCIHMNCSEDVQQQLQLVKVTSENHECVQQEPQKDDNENELGGLTKSAREQSKTTEAEHEERDACKETGTVVENKDASRKQSEAEQDTNVHRYQELGFKEDDVEEAETEKRSIKMVSSKVLAAGACVGANTEIGALGADFANAGKTEETTLEGSATAGQVCTPKALSVLVNESVEPVMKISCELQDKEARLSPIESQDISQPTLVEAPSAVTEEEQEEAQVAAEEAAQEAEDAAAGKEDEFEVEHVVSKGVDDTEEEDEFEVEHVVSKGVDDTGVLKYLVRWKGYGPEEDT